MPERLEVEELRELVARLGKPALVLSDSELATVGDLGVAIAAHCSEAWRALLADAVAATKPLLYAYASDGWSRMVSETKTFRFQEHLVKRRGKVRAEFLLEKEILKSISPDGDVAMAMGFCPPRPMVDGKGGWAIFQAATERRGRLRLECPGNIITEWHVQDGHHANQIGRYMAGSHAVFYDYIFDVDEEGDPLAREKDMVLSFRCILHVASSAIHWGMRAFADKTTLDDIHIGIASLRNSSLSILAVADDFVREFVEFDREPSEDAEGVELFWRLLGVKEKMLRDVCDLDPFWCPLRKRLLMSSRFADNPQRREKALAVLALFLRWQDFSETRWAGATRSGRMLLASFACGIDGVVSLCYSKKKNTSKLGGFSRLDARAKRYAVVVALAHSPLDGFSLSLLHDDRFLRNAASLKVQLHQRADIVLHTPLHVYERISCLFKGEVGSAGDLRHDVAMSLYTGIAYLEREGYGQIDSFPLCLTQGDIRANVAALPDVETDDVVTKALQTLLQFHVPAETIVSTIVLWTEAPCSVALCEKAHGAGSLIAQAHGQYNMETLAIRALLCSAKPMFSLSQWDLKDLRLGAKEDRILRKTGRITARNLFVAAKVRDELGLMVASVQKTELRKGVYAKHNENFDALSFEEQRAFRRAAEAETSTRRLENTRKRDLVVAARAENAEKKARAEADRVGVLNLVSSCRLSEEQMESFCELLAAGRGKPLSDIVNTTSPGEPDNLTKEDIETRGKGMKGTWCSINSPGGYTQSMVSMHRDSVYGQAFFTSTNEDGDPEMLFVLALCMQNPDYTRWMRCRKTEELFAGHFPMYRFADKWEYEVGTDFMENAEELWMQNVSAVGLDFVPYGEVLDAHIFFAQLHRIPKMEATKEEKKVQKRNDLVSRIREKLPFLSVREIEDGLNELEEENKEEESEEEEEEPVEAEVVANAHVMTEEHATEFDDAKGRVRYAISDVPFDDFYPRVMGGPWTDGVINWPYDRFAALPRAHTLKWRTLFGIKTMHSFALSYYGGEENCTMLVRGWIAKQSYFYTVWCEKGQPEAEYTHDEVQGYIDDVPWLDWVLTLDQESEEYNQAMVCWNWVPFLAK